MNRLKICQDANTLAGTQGRIDSTVSPVGYQATLILMVDKAYNDIQIYRKYWHFLRAMVQAPLNTTTNTFSDANIARIDKLVYDYKPLKFMNYDNWVLREWTTTDKPTYWTYDPATLEITTNPLDATYIVDVYYWSIPDVMTTNSSVPIIPDRYQDLIIHKALMNLGGSYLGNYDLASSSATAYSFMLGEMMRTQLPSRKISPQPFVI